MMSLVLVVILVRAVMAGANAFPRIVKDFRKDVRRPYGPDDERAGRTIGATDTHEGDEA
jgi:hypothetical protein